MKEKVKYLGFDLDNTLIDRDGAFEKSVTKLVTERSFMNTALLKMIIEKDRSGLIEREELYRWMIATIPLDMNVEDMFDFFASHMGSFIAPGPKVNALLEELSQKYTLFLITNGNSKNQRSKIAHSGLGVLFGKNIFISGEIGYAKPEKEIFEYALKTIGGNANETAYIGDNPETDIRGANNSSLISILIQKPYNTGESCCRPHTSINDLSDLKPLFL